MGSDASPEALFEAVLEFAAKLSIPVHFVVFTTLSWSTLFAGRCAGKSITLQVCGSFIEMEDHPFTAIRRKRSSSLFCAIDALAKGSINALVTPGNTGALLLKVRQTLPLFPWVRRPALLATLPSAEGNITVVDVGGNIDSKAEDLYNFAQMGVVYHREFYNHPFPKIGLLNIGIEPYKGNASLRAVHRLLTANPLPHAPFIGNIEGRAVFEQQVDVLVTDGLTGNVLIKTAEGLSSLLLNRLGEASLPHDQIRRSFDYESQGGALICGIEGLIIKCHGAASKRSLDGCIAQAIQLLEKGMVAIGLPKV